jgi:DNA polymerase I
MAKKTSKASKGSADHFTSLSSFMQPKKESKKPENDGSIDKSEDAAFKNESPSESKPSLQKQSPDYPSAPKEPSRPDETPVHPTPSSLSMPANDKIPENPVETPQDKKDTGKKSKKKPESAPQTKVPDPNPSVPIATPEQQIKSKPIVRTYFPQNPIPIGDMRFTDQLARIKSESQKSWHLRLLKDAGEIVQEMDRGLLLAVEYDGQENKAYAKFYDLTDETIKIWIDTTNHEPYCLHEKSEEELLQMTDVASHPGFKRIEMVPKIDLIVDRVKQMAKIYGLTPTDIGGANGMRDLLGGAWEANIRYHHNFIYDRLLIPGLVYRIHEGNIIQIPGEVDAQLANELMEKFKGESPEIREMAKYYDPIFSSPVPDIKRVAYDIEVAEAPNGALPDPMTAKYAVISVAFCDNRGKKWVYVLDRNDIQDGVYPTEFPADANVFFFKEERELLLETFRVFWDYPLVIAFNSDNFDNTYLYHRAKNLKIDEAQNPIVIERGGGVMISRKTDYKHAIHVDIFQFFSNRSIKGYAFGGAYLKNSLEDVSTSLLGTGKIKHDGVLIGQMILGDLIHYNLNDAILTMELTKFNQNLVLDLLVILMRITKLPLQDVFRLQISAWVRSLLYFEHRRKNYLIPRRDDMEEANEDGFSEAGSEGKAFQGAYVVDPIPGIHFNVAVMDFSSLYPSIIKTRNLSYETVNCIHAECKTNLLPNTPHWACTKRQGIFAYVVGFLRDIRVKWFKPLSGNKQISANQRQTAKVMQSALKVFINGAYGVFGSEQFPLFCLPVAESTTAIGRFSIQQTIKKAEELGVKVLYGDSDSVFLAQPSDAQVQQLISWASERLDLDLEKEKTYQFLALSGRKKNYVGVRKGGDEVDIKGLLAKKHNTPEFIKLKFNETVEILKQITDMPTFEEKKNQIIQIVKTTNKLIGKSEKEGGFPLEQYSIAVMLPKRLSAYVKNVPQHVKAAMMLPEAERRQLEIGSFIYFVKCRTKEGVKPLSLASLADLDIGKYKEFVQSTFEQVLDALGIDYEEIKGVKKLDLFFK